MENDIFIRPFKPDDLSVVISLLQEVSDFSPDADQLTHLGSLFEEDKSHCSLVIEYNGFVIGFGSLFFLRRIRGGASGVIEDMVIDKQFRGKGLGKLLVKGLLDRAKDRGCFKVTLESAQNAENFYRSLGFVDSHKTFKLILN